MAYPLVLNDLVVRRCVVVGGGQVAERKIHGLLDAGALPQVISPSLTEQLGAWADAGQVHHIARGYEPGDLAGASLVFAATNDAVLNRRVAEDARHAGALVNLADDGAASDFSTPATVRRGDLLLTISTAGASPILAAHIRRELEQYYGTEYAALAADLRALREGPLRAMPAAERAHFWATLDIEALLGQLREKYGREGIA
jgi:precorrin-2 dehydrogenase/sirohydrochlorin ferrochelatase